MKNRKCPIRKNCFDYKDNNCGGCEIGNSITKLYRKIERLEKQNIVDAALLREYKALVEKLEADKTQLERNLAECEVGYEGSLFMERCKMKDLTEEIERLKGERAEQEKCPCRSDKEACCTCVSMHCDECHKPMQSKFQQGRYCSNCGRLLKEVKDR